MEGKYTIETKAQNTDQSEESMRIEGPTWQPQEQGNTLSIQGNTTPINRNASFSLPWIKGPTRACDRLSTVPTHRPCTRGPTYQFPYQRGWPNAVILVQLNWWFGQTSFGVIALPPARGASTLDLKVGSKWAPLVCQPKHPLDTSINMRGGDPTPTHNTHNPSLSYLSSRLISRGARR
jgi:hypothetical protein